MFILKSGFLSSPENRRFGRTGPNSVEGWVSPSLQVELTLVLTQLGSAGSGSGSPGLDAISSSQSEALPLRYSNFSSSSSSRHIITTFVFILVRANELRRLTWVFLFCFVLLLSLYLRQEPQASPVIYEQLITRYDLIFLRNNSCQPSEKHYGF